MQKLIVIAALCLPASAWAHGHHHSGRGVPWCGIFMMQHTGIHGPGNLARAIEWAHVGQAASGPAPGEIVVWPHHVGMITGRSGSQWTVLSGNDGNAVRDRPRSLAGAVAFRRI
jgi:uncharacterized protein (TIGR02594 family)